MNHKGVLSSTFNMSMGFIPIIISILLCEFISQDAAIYIGTGVGIAYMVFSFLRRGIQAPNFILLIATIVQLLVTLSTFIPCCNIPHGALPITLEAGILIPMLILFMHKKRFINHFLKQINSCQRRLFAQGAECTIVSARITLILGTLHFIIISIAIILYAPLSPTRILIFYKIFPPIVFITSIILNQIAIQYFNHLMSHTEYVPVVNTQGDVIGKSLAFEAVNYKNTYINPVIRIAISVHGMLYLCDRPTTSMLDTGKTDIPMECYLRYGESLSEGVERLIGSVFSKGSPSIHPEFNIVYHFENEVTNRLIYLFIVEIEDESILDHVSCRNGKLWHFSQIEENLHKNFFSSCFEEEYEHLKDVIYIKEKYKES